MYREKKSQGIDYLLFAVVFLSFGQTVIHVLPEEYTYRVSEYAMTDIIFCALCLSNLIKTSYRDIRNKASWAVLTVYFLYALICNILSQFVFDDIFSSVLITLNLIGFLSLAFCLRYLLRWKPYRDGVRVDVLYLVISRPETPAQLLVAAYTGLGGAFGITDGTSLWHYSIKTGCMVRESMPSNYLLGRMVIKLCDSSEARCGDLNKMTGSIFGVFHNCLEILSLAKKWGTV